MSNNTSATVLSPWVSITQRSRASPSQASELVNSLTETSVMYAHFHGVSPKNAAAAASTANPIATANPLQIPYQSFGRFAGAAISASAENSPLDFTEQLADGGQELHEVEWLG